MSSRKHLTINEYAKLMGITRQHAYKKTASFTAIVDGQKMIPVEVLPESLQGTAFHMIEQIDEGRQHLPSTDVKQTDDSKNATSKVNVATSKQDMTIENLLRENALLTAQVAQVEEFKTFLKDQLAIKDSQIAEERRRTEAKQEEIDKLKAEVSELKAQVIIENARAIRKPLFSWGRKKD